MVLSLLNGERELEGVAMQVSDELGRQVIADNVGYVVEHKLAPLGLLASSTGEHPFGEDRALPRSIPLLALRYRTRVIPARFHRSVTAALQPLFWPPLVLVVLGGLLATTSGCSGRTPTHLPRPPSSSPFIPPCSCW